MITTIDRRSIAHAMPWARIATAATFFLAIASAVQAITFQFDVVDAAGQGFNDPALGPQRLAAVQFAGQYWGSLLPNSFAGETINVNVSFTAPSTTRADSQNIEVFANSSGMSPNVWYGPALANHLVGMDLDPSLPEMAFRYNAALPWYSGTDGNPSATQLDLVTATLNLMEHGLGFNTRLFRGDGTFFVAPGVPQYPGPYDFLLTTDLTGGTALTNMGESDRAAAIASGNLYWMGSNAAAANGGVRPKLFAPNPFQGGASIVNLDPIAFPNALLRGGGNSFGEVNRPSPIELGMLRDIGWTVVPEPSSFVLLCVGLLVLPFHRGR